MKPQGASHLRVLCGPPGSGKTTAVLAAYSNALMPAGSPDLPRQAGQLGQTPRGRWLAPTRAAASSVREAVADRAGAILDPGVATFSQVAADLLRDAGLLLTPITSLQRRRLLGRVVAEAAAAGRLDHYATLAGRPGLIALVDEGLARLQQRGLTPADFTASAANEGDPRDRDLALLFELYMQRLVAAGFVDGHTVLSHAASVLSNRPDFGGGLAMLVVDGFSDLTTIEFELLRNLAKRAAVTLVTLPGEPVTAQAPRPDLFARPRAALERLVRELGAVVEYLPPHEASWPAQAHLERNLFRRYRDTEVPGAAAAASLNRVQILAASGVQAEVVEIARRVKRLLIAGAVPRDVVVAFRSTRDVAERVRPTFADYGIPFSIDAPRRLAATQLARTLQGVLRLVADDWPYRRLLQVAGDRLIRVIDGAVAEHANPNASDRGPSTAPADVGDPRRAIEICVRYAQLASGRRALFAQLDHWASDAERTADPRPADAALARRTLADLAAHLDLLPTRANIERWIAALGSLADGLGILRPATGDVPANWAILVRGLRAAGRIDAAVDGHEAELTLAELLDLFASVAAQAPASADGDSVGRVVVASAEAARLLKPRHLLLGGLTEQSFPAPPRGSLAGVGGAAADADAARSAEMLLFYQLVTRPTDTLTLSYPALDERAQALPASPYLAELERAFGDLRVPFTQQPLNYASQAVQSDEPPLAASELRQHAVARALEDKPSELAALTSSRDGDPGIVAGAAIVAGIESVASRGRRDEFGPFDGVFASPAAAAQLAANFGAHAIWSPSRLERYAECPFLFFGEHLLRLKPAPEFVLASDARRRGSLLHAALAQLYTALREQPFDAAPDAAEAIALGMVDQFRAALDAVAGARPGRGVDAAIREIERRQIAAWADAFAQQDADYHDHWSRLDAPPRPAYFEVRFGPGSRSSESADDATLSTDKPFQLEAKIDGRAEVVQFTGQIDRIDVGRVGDRPVFNVIDYKTGARSMVKPDEIHAGRQIQLPLYALAVEQLLLADEKAAALSAGYWSVLGQGYRAKARTGGPLAINDVDGNRVTPAKDWKSTQDQLVERIGEMIAAIRRGEFPVFNENQQCTSHCDLRTICRIAHVRSVEKLWPSPVRKDRK